MGANDIGVVKLRRYLDFAMKPVDSVPISRFVLRFHAGARGVVGLARGLCGPGSAAAVRVRIASQGGTVERARPALRVRGC